MSKPSITVEEHKTYDLFQSYLNDNWTSSAQAVANLFNSHHTRAFIVKDIAIAIFVLYGYGRSVNEVPEELTTTLVRMTRAKVLRSYVKRGQRFYEVNY